MENPSLLQSPLPTFGYVVAKVSTPPRRHFSPLRRDLRRSERKHISEHYKTHRLFIFPSTQFFTVFLSLALVWFVFLKLYSQHRPPCPPGNRSQPNDSAMAPPRTQHLPLWTIRTDSSLGRPSESITSLCSTVHLFQNEVFPPPMRSSTSPYRTAVGRHFVPP